MHTERYMYVEVCMIPSKIEGVILCVVHCCRAIENFI